MCWAVGRNLDALPIGMMLLLAFPALPGGAGVREEVGVGGGLGPLIEVLSGKVTPPQQQQQQQEPPPADHHLQYMVHLYQRSADQLGKPRANRTLTTNTIRLLKPCASLVLPSTGPWYTHYVQYNLKHLPELEHLVKVAVVYLYKNAMISCEIRCVPATYAHSKLLQNATSLELPIRLEVKLNNRWSEADVTSCVLFPNRNNAWKLDLHISYMCTKQGKNSRGKKRKVPFHLPVPSLLLFLNDTDEAAHQRKRGEDSQIPVIPKSKILSRKPRQLSNIGSDIPNYLRKKNLPRNQCKLRSFLVSFQQLGWDHWIIAPPKYDPKFCKGACPRILHYGYHSPNHAIVQTFINEIIDKNVPRPSCVPLKYNPISVLLKENDQIVYKEYEDMIAVSCTCK